MKRVEEVLEEMGIKYEYHKVDGDNYYGLVEFWTDTAGQDIPTEFDFDGTAEDFIKEFTESAENYDIDEEMRVYIPMLGANGCPDSSETLLEDIKEAKRTLMEIASRLNAAIGNRYTDPWVVKREKILKYVKENGPFKFDDEDGFDEAISTMIGNIIDHAIDRPVDEIADFLENIIPWINAEELEEIINEN